MEIFKKLRINGSARAEERPNTSNPWTHGGGWFAGAVRSSLYSRNITLAEE